MPGLTRKEFLKRTGTLFGGAYTSMLAMGLIKEAPVNDFDLNKTESDKSIVIIGAGLAGLTAAWELEKLGYNCMILEARDRAGGRCWSVRNGSNNTEMESGDQTAKFDNGLYFNAGPSRIPHHHKLTLHYCKALGIPLEVYNNVNEAAYVYSEGSGPLCNKKIRAREIRNDIRGYMSELLARAVDQDQLDLEMSGDDVESVIQYLRAEGALNNDKLYQASARRGYNMPPGVTSGTVSDAYSLSDIIASGFMEPDFYNVAEYTYELQMTMFQAVGGMDRISDALEGVLKTDINLGAEVTAIENREEGVEVEYITGGVKNVIEADYCICTIPFSVLRNIPHNFSGSVSRAIDYATYNSTAKIGLQFKRRFWEEDEEIYGGITRTNNDLTQIFYPSNDYHSEKGVLIGAYNFGDRAARFGNLGYDERTAFALEKGSQIHPQYKNEFEHAFSVSWENTKYSLGGWAEYNRRTRQMIHSELQEPDGRVYFAGEHCTYLNAWMAGAFESARSVVGDLHSRINERQFNYEKITN